ncbi:hypothetical protein BRPE64_ECDS01810 (plasmid) [Caballeronia insecticola]|uniref:Uncharacterized protein n=1 Tax=Caballeronia insecticola TaxID=758793 RepID=A0A060PJF4_9BURK|nr:hypothetical protein BRPE64_ECDS01810 [Caballeronia insecticola]
MKTAFARSSVPTEHDFRVPAIEISMMQDFGLFRARRAEITNQLC